MSETLLLEAVKLLGEWCAAVDRDNSWDGWDYFYKKAAWGTGVSPELHDMIKAVIASEEERKH